MKIAVLYVARDWEPLGRFSGSYFNHDPGVNHDLIALEKGISASKSFQGFTNFPDRAFATEVPNRGFDLGAYRYAALRLGHEYEFLCLLNSHSVILDHNWLLKMYKPFALGGDDVGLVGTTASCESMYENGLVNRKWFNSIRRWYFPPFPNPHIRTQGILIRRHHLLEMWPLWFPTKRHCYLFESGYNSLWRKMRARGLKAVIVGKDGHPREVDWATSQTFRNGEQENLLIADNQTCRYQRGTKQERTTLAGAAWGI